MNKRLVAYFSASGTTAKAARAIAEAAGADLYEIRPEVPYTSADLNWTNNQSRSSVEMNDPSFRPPLADHDANIASYDVIFLGFPIWWYTAPSIIKTFLEAYDFSGKTIIPFATSGGSGLGKTVKALQDTVPSATVRDGAMMNGKQKKNVLTSWIRNLGI